MADLQRSVGTEMDFHSSLHVIIISLITIFGGYLALQYQSLKKSPLEDHKNIMAAIYGNLFMYGVGLMAEFKLSNCCGTRCLSIIKRFTPLFGILVVVLMMIILYPVVGFLALVLWALLTIEAVIHLFEEILQWLLPICREIVPNYFNRTENRSPGTQENGSASMEANDFPREIELPV